MKNLGTRTLKTNRLVLRQFTLEDVDAVYDNWASDDRVTRFLMWPTHPDKDVTRAVVETWVAQYEEPGVYIWGITCDGVLIGTISVVGGDVQSECAEVGYCLGYDWWGYGLMTEALHAVLAFLFDEVQMHRVFLRHDVQNVGSGQVMRKNGLVYEGTLREEYRRKDGTYADMAYYGMLRHEWAAARPG